MPQFSYKAKSGPGHIQEGRILAENETAVIKKLRQEGLYPVSIREVNFITQKKSHKKISSRNISDFTRQLSNLIHSGFSLDVALSTLSQQEQNPAFKKIIEDLHEKIQKGFTFSQALSEYPQAFSSFYINMVNIGETSGKIDETLARLADFKERENDLVSQVRSSLVYPGFLFVMGIISVFVMITFIVPRFASMFASFGQALPLPTQIIIKLSAFMNKFWFPILLALVLLIVLAARFFKIEKNRLIMDKLVLKLPLAKSLVQKIEIARFTYALGVLLKSGVSILEALGVVSTSVNNRVFRQSISSFGENIRKGQSLSSCLQAQDIYPAILINTVRVGEEGGELADMLLKTASMYETEVARTVKTLVTLIEPVLILCIGGFVILIILSIILPVFQMNLLVQ